MIFSLLGVRAHLCLVTWKSYDHTHLLIHPRWHIFSFYATCPIFMQVLRARNMAYKPLLGVLLVCFVVLSFSVISFTKPVEKSNAFTAWLKRLDSEIKTKVMSSGSCEVCKLLVSLAQAAFLANKIEDDVVFEAQKICEELKIEDDRVCTQVILEFRTEALTVTDKVLLSPSEVCGNMFGPTCAHKRDPSEFWNITVPGKKPPVKPVPPPKVSKRF